VPVSIFRLAAFLFFFPLALTAASGTSINIGWTANLEPDIAGYRVHYGTATQPYQFLIDVPNTTATIGNLQSGVTYTFAVTAYNFSGAESAYSGSLSYTVGSSRVIPTAVLANISSRAKVLPGENVMIGGFIVEGVVSKKVALRAIGPSLAAAGVTGALSDPYLQLVDSNGAVVAANDNWNVPGQEIASYGIAPADGREAALVATLTPGNYSAIVSGQNNSSGIGLVELYDLEMDKGRVADVSTRSRVETQDNVLIGGFILTGTSGNKVIVRALGPSLGALGVHDALLDPTLELYDGNGELWAANDNWRSTQELDIIDSLVPPTEDRESAIVIFLPPGGYSAVVRGANNTTGVALVEVYALN
jgi:hypothetical protein